MKKTQATLVKTRLQLTDAQPAKRNRRSSWGWSTRPGRRPTPRPPRPSRGRSPPSRRPSTANDALAKLAAKDEERGMVITLSGGVLFRSNDAQLLPAAQTKLDDVAAALLTNGRPVSIEGIYRLQGLAVAKHRSVAAARGVGADLPHLAGAPGRSGGGEGNGTGSPHRRQLQRRGAGQQSARGDRGRQARDSAELNTLRLGAPSSSRDGPSSAGCSSSRSTSDTPATAWRTPPARSATTSSLRCSLSCFC